MVTTILRSSGKFKEDATRRRNQKQSDPSFWDTAWTTFLEKVQGFGD
jgi:hypothetical protein